MTRTIFGVAAATAFATASLAFAVDEVQTSVDVEAGPAADVRGTLAGEADVFRFSAAAGAQLTFRATASPARSLRFDVHLFAPSGAEVPIVGVPRSVNRRGLASLTRFALPASGRYALRVGGTGAGAYRLTWTTDPEAARPEKLDLRGAPLGRASGIETAVCRPVAAGAPTTLTVASTSDLVGASLIVPADAAPPGTSVLLTSATAPAVPDAATRHAAGPALAVSPEGLVLSSAATLTVPYDPFLVPRGADPAAVLAVARVASDGTSVALDPVSVDTQRHTVTVTTDRFSRFVASAPKGPLDPTGKTYWRASFDVSFTTDAGGDSSQRDVNVRVGRATFAPGGEMPSAGAHFQGEWRHDHAGAVSAVGWGWPGVVDSSTWRLAADGRRIEVSDPFRVTSLFEISENGQALVGQLDGRTTLPSCRIDVALLRADRAPTMTELAGAWTFGMIELDMTWGDRPQPLGLEVGRTLATLNLRANGTWTISVDARGARFAPRSGKIGRTAFRGAVGGRWSVVGPGGGWAEGAAKLTIVTPMEPVNFYVLPAADGRSFVGCTDMDTSLSFFFGVRKSTSMTHSAATGEFAATELDLAIDPYPASAGGRDVSDVVLTQTQARVAFDGSGLLAVTSGEHESVVRDPSADGGVRSEFAADDPVSSIPFSLTRAGALTVQVDPQILVVGALASDASTGFVVSSPRPKAGDFGLRVMVKSPPSR